MKGHGTTTRYKNGCRCERCRQANTNYHRHRRSAGTGLAEPLQQPNPWEPVDGMLPVECWCRRKVVKVAVEDIQQLRTQSCGEPDCGPEQVQSA
jgi:hypothetical protein